MSLIKFPFSLGWRIVFEPAHLIMWIIVDKIGDGQIWGAKRLLLYPSVKKTIAYVKEFRAVLVDYYKWPKIPSPLWRCKFCSKKAEWWCVECAKKMCPQCAYNQHAPGTLAMMHSVEEIVKEVDKIGVHFLSPILPELMFGFFAYWIIFSKTLLADDYLSSQAVCPAVDELRAISASVDATLFYYYKNMFFTWCDFEDSFMRFILDGWVRTLITGTDNTILVFQTFPKALLVDVVLMSTLCPILSVLYACLLTIVYTIESKIPRVGVLCEVEKYSEACASFGSWFGAGDATPFPPETKWRNRPMWDIVEGFWYARQRCFKRLSYYFDSSLDGMKNAAWQLLMGSMVFRLACIWLNLAPLFRGILSLVGFSSFIQSQQAKFSGAGSLIVNEPLLRSLASKAFSAAQPIISSSIFVKLSGVWAFFLVLAVIGNVYWVNYLVQARRKFFLGWFAEGGTQETSLEFKQKLTLQKTPAAAPAAEKNGKAS